MSPYTRNKKRLNIFFVAVNQYLYFGFKPKDLTSFTGISNDDVAALGHIQTSAIPEGGLRIIGAQTPKPHKVKKIIPNAAALQQKSVSTFAAFNKIAEAKSKGWNLIENRKSVVLTSPNSFRTSLTAIATLSNSLLYCFPMNKADFDTYGSELGLKNSSQIINDINRQKLVSGADIPKPGQASRKTENGIFSSFYSDAKEGGLVNAGWSILSQEKILETGVPF
jgi:hypothetical protein